jgi:dCMP deaminase
VKDKRVIGQGYNGVASGKVHCIDGGCPRGKMSYSEVPAGSDYNEYRCDALHAEHNAILQAGLRSCVGATLYVTDKPCQQCTNLIEHAKISRVVIDDRRDWPGGLRPEGRVVVQRQEGSPHRGLQA